MSTEAIPFEGVEKRLVIQFARVHEDEALPFGEWSDEGLVKSPLSMSAAEWQSVLNEACCEVVSEVSQTNRSTGEVTRVYLLSESTLTVWKQGFLLKTCGRTTPFLALKAFLTRYSCSTLDHLNVSWMTYSRLNFLHPEFQIYPHRTFDEEQTFATEHFMPLAATLHACSLPAGRFVLHVLFYSRDRPGQQDLARSETYATLSDSARALTSPVSKLSSDPTGCDPSGSDPSGSDPVGSDPPSDDLGYLMNEVLMTRIRPDCVRCLTGYDNKQERDTSHEQASVLRDVLAAKSEHNVVDEFWFDPCGYSANVLFESEDGRHTEYFSTHISPEDCTSYASLEIGSCRPVASLLKQSQFALEPLVDCFDAQNLNVTRVLIVPSNHQASTHDYPLQTEQDVTTQVFANTDFTCLITHTASTGSSFIEPTTITRSTLKTSEMETSDCVHDISDDWVRGEQISV
ncbi:S-adenosylmethionine decarboxylase [Gregarina niphandrodes]|uniref:S-adenosylmethionine decarboxylase n=1 Tax=Gregarina niphandrodes TaxID=110365 RepID=A0A023AY91_GRENI|nr:S-adenosylmethionine decarboxylase [Gregarina niphandrodes]EZG43626.1 S-adenosylmethionine decarboxylase [Gregarina niphandrodes]|eukprot:XP_011133154.1 S-adenosylmethionine decarboxylase [Gregarina niphandrodes]